MPEIETPVGSEGKPICQQQDYDKIINDEVTFQLNERLQLVKVKGRAVGNDGKVNGYYNDNHILDTITCDIESPDRKVRECTANEIAENLLSRVDD